MGRGKREKRRRRGEERGEEKKKRVFGRLNAEGRGLH